MAGPTASPGAPAPGGGPPYPSDNIVGWVAAHLPAAIEFAEREHLATRRARRYHADLAVASGRCAIGHDWSVVSAHPCGYCETAREHASLWGPPAGRAAAHLHRDGLGKTRPFVLIDLGRGPECAFVGCEDPL